MSGSDGVADIAVILRGLIIFVKRDRIVRRSITYGASTVIAWRPQADEAIAYGRLMRPRIEIASSRYALLAMTWKLSYLRSLSFSGVPHDDR
jgi:hypothetical protein